MSRVYLTTFGPVGPDHCAAVEEYLAARFGVATARLEPLTVPAEAFETARSQYNAFVLMRVLAASVPRDAVRILALTDFDLAIPMLSFIYGQAQLDGKAAMVSLARLRQEFYGLPPHPESLTVRLLKEVLHEMGHTFGLIHCTNSGCPMTLATNIRQLDLKGETLCGHCSLLLNKRLAALQTAAPETTS